MSAVSLPGLLVDIRDRNVNLAELDYVAGDIQRLKQLGLVAGEEGLPTITPAGARTLLFLDADRRMTLRYARVLAEASFSQVNCLREASIAVAVFVSGGSLFIRAGQDQNVQSNFRQTGDQSDVEAILRVYQELVEHRRNGGNLVTECDRQSLNLSVFENANRIHAEILRLARRQTTFRINDKPASYEALSWAFLVGFGEQLMWGEDDRYMSCLDSETTDLQLARESVLARDQQKVVLPVCLRQVKFNRGSGRAQRSYDVTLVTAAMSVTMDQLRRRFGQRFSTAEHDHHWKNSRRDWDDWGWERGPDCLMATRVTCVDGHCITRTVCEAGPGALTQRYLAERILQAAELPNASAEQSKGLEALLRLRRFNARAALGFQLDSGALQQLIIQRRVGDNPVEITWQDLATLTGDAEVEQKVAAAALVFPDQLIVQGCRLPVEYGEHRITVSIALPEATAALRELTVSTFPSQWGAREVLVLVTRDKEKHIGHGHSDDALDQLRVKVATEPLRNVYLCLPADATKLMQVVMVEHPGSRCEGVYVVNSVSGHQQTVKEHTIKRVAFAAALSAVRHWLQEVAAGAERTYRSETANGCAASGNYDVDIDQTLRLLSDGGALSRDILERAARTTAEGVVRQLKEVFTVRSTRRAQLLEDSRQVRSLAEEQGKGEAVALASECIRVLCPKLPATFAPPTSDLDSADGSLSKARGLLDAVTLTDGDGLRLRLRDELRSLQERATEAGVKGSVKTAVKELLGAQVRLLTEGKTDVVAASMPATTAAIEMHCKNPVPVPVLRGGLRGLDSTPRRK
jgi:hypothetical protein